MVVDRADRRVLSALSAHTVRLLLGEEAPAEPPRLPEKVYVAPARVTAATAAQVKKVREGLKVSGRRR